MQKFIRVAILALVSFMVLAPPGQAITIVSAPVETVGVGDTFAIPISITGATDLTSWQFDLVFNPAVVQVNSVAEGPFLSSFGMTLFTPGVIDTLAGLVSLVADSYVDLPPNPSGDGVLAIIEFTALATGSSSLNFSNVFLSLSDQGFEVTNSQISVIPEPATLVLLGSGLAILVARRMARRKVPDE